MLPSCNHARSEPDPLPIRKASCNPITVSEEIFSGVGVAVTVGVDEGVGTGVLVDGIGVNVSVGGIGVEAGAHPLNKTVRNKNPRKSNPIDFFMTLSPFDSI
jgi:hypothetical protein